MVSRIRILSEEVINKVAAGEVVENSASVVKELVENSLDAGATEITVEIQSGGRNLIRVTDNGCGMNRDDALLSLERHGTSKIRDIDHLNEVMTMGFRGEAIPSIASISKLTLITCESAKEGTIVIVEGGRIIKCSSAIRDPGTTIEVKSLFYNVPVRIKFQKSPSHDTNEVMKTMSLLAMGHPFIQFQLISDQKVLLTCRSDSSHSFEEQFKKRISDVLGAEFVALTLPLKFECAPYQIQGVIGKPSYTRNNRTGQYFFLNQRPIWCPLVSYAIKDSYKTVISPERHPIFVLQMQIPPSLVDVNVHPQKKEVRLREEYALRKMIIEAVSQALHSQGCVKISQESNSSEDYVEQISPSLFPWDLSPKTLEPASSWLPLDEEITKQVVLPSKQLQISRSNEERSSDLSSSFDLKISATPPQVIATAEGYLIVEHLPPDNSLGIIDQYRAHHRILFERYLIQHEDDQRIAEVQMLLIPYTFHVTATEAALLKEHLQTLNRMGLGIREFGQHTFVVDAIPTYLADRNLEEFISQILQDLHQFQDSDCLEKEKNRMAILILKRAAVARNKKLNGLEAEKIVSQLFLCKTPYHCPFGKTTVKFLNRDMMTKLFQ